MDAFLWREARRIFDEVVVVPRENWAKELDGLCGENAQLSTAVWQLLNAYEETPFSEGNQSPLLDHLEQVHLDSFLGKEFGPYRLIEAIGQGGMGFVFLAERIDGEIRQKVAVKFLRLQQGANQVQRFLLERQMLANLKHPNICRLLDANHTSDGAPYLVMEYIEGVDLLTYCDQNALSIRKRIDLFLEICDAISYAHQSLIIHRDIKSSNILVDQEGRPKLVDFGIAKQIVGEKATADITTTRQRMFSPLFASPEQVRGETPTLRVDVYGLGILLYELLCGLYPFSLENFTPVAIETAILQHHPPAPSRRLKKPLGSFNQDVSRETLLANRCLSSENALRKTLEGDLDAIVMKAMAPEVERRYSQVEALSQDIRSFLSGMSVNARQAGMWYRLGKFVRRYRIPLGLTAISFVFLLGFSILTFFQARALSVEKDNALAQKHYAQEMNRFLADMFRNADSLSQDPISDVNVLLERGAKRIETEFKGQPFLKASLMTTVGGIFANNGDTEKGRIYLDRAIALFNDQESEEWARTQNALGVLSLVEGKVDEADRRVRDALQYLQRHFPDSAPVILQNKGLLVQILYRQGRVNEMRDLILELLAVYESMGKPGKEWALLLNELSVVYQIQGKLEESKEALHTCLDMYRELHGEKSPLLAPPLHNLAFLHYDLGQYDEAEILARESLALRLEHWPPESPYVLETQVFLGIILEVKGKVEQARDLFEGLRHTVALNLSETHFMHLSSLNKLGRFYLRTGDLERSRFFFEAGLAQLLKMPGDISADVAFAYRFLGMQAQAEGDFAASVAFFRMAVNGHRSVFGENTSHVGYDRVLLGKALASTGQVQDGLLQCETGLGILNQNVVKLDPVRTAWVKGNYGFCLMSMGDFPKALAQLASSHESLCALLGPNGLTHEVYNWLEACRSQMAKNAALAGLNSGNARSGRQRPQ